MLPIQYQFGEQACAAADIEPTRADRRLQPVEKDRAGGAAPMPDESLISCAVVKAMRNFCHGSSLTFPQASVRLDTGRFNQRGIDGDFRLDKSIELSRSHDHRIDGQCR